MLHLFMNSGLVLIMLCSECSFMKHKNKIVVLKTQKICASPRMKWWHLSPNSQLCRFVVGIPIQEEARNETGGKGLCDGRGGTADASEPNT